MKFDIQCGCSCRCRELDEVIGDTATSISEHETDIMVRLTKHILARSVVVTFKHLCICLGLWILGPT